MCNLMYKMPEKTYLSVFILFAFLAYGIVGTVPKDDLGDSTNSLIRQKRVINRIPGKDIPVSSPFTVSIKESNSIHCIGTILSLKTIITAARCFTSRLSMYKVYAGSIYSERGTIHNITEKRMHGNHPIEGQTFETGIALIYINPSFQPRRDNIATIGLHSEPILTGTIGVVHGWGTYFYGGRCESKYKGRLRAIEVPVISHRDCISSFRGFFGITETYFCTHDIHQQCAYTDTGAAFILDDSLAGIYMGLIKTGDSYLKPDVFIMVQHPDYHQWILSNIEQ